MASGNDVKSYHSTLTSTDADEVLLTQFWPHIEITNHSASERLDVRFDGVTAIRAAKSTQVIMPGKSKVFGPADGIFANAAPIGVPGSTTAATACHRASLVGDGNAYSVEGVGT
jgi:hypothetical protein